MGELGADVRPGQFCGYDEEGAIVPMEPMPAGPYAPASRLIEFRGPTYTACQLLTFHNADGDKVGWLDWQDGKLTFGGDMAESARMFFEYFKPLVEAYFQTVRDAERARDEADGRDRED